MTSGWCSRTVRAVVFAAVCVLLAALGHVLMSPAPVPGWALAAGATATGATAWILAGRERGPWPVGSVAVAAQAALHTLFAFAQALVPPDSPGGGSLTGRVSAHLLMRRHAAPHHVPGDGTVGTTAGAPHAGYSVHTDHTAHSLAADGLSPTGMLAAHLLAALLCALWLARGERAAFRILRAVAGRLFAPLSGLLPRRPAPPDRPRVRVRRAGRDRKPRRLLLAHTITTRGPPAGVAVV
ncbi:hypothetical protein [Streptomyces prasinopilosus]|uniref:Integral membrane protein n=1 Tax=Streptomyces prasinopilosus TaxID=67344 RepID=A0A1G6TM02_9ACTN|nr:hypothetical protein [Streptomyces prasinopilosus]SDD30081.1 hypothetical protein SAMN05216505_106246 [Streptomyces prasinopilosus]